MWPIIKEHGVTLSWSGNIIINATAALGDELAAFS
jgi:hypothetical protein